MHIPALDGLRGVAILLVFMSHVSLALVPANRIDSQIRTFGLMGWTGVDLFFVLSGFLITGILLDTQGRTHWWRSFFARRALRIMPLYYGALALLFFGLPLTALAHRPAVALLLDHQAWYWTYTVNILRALEPQGAPLNTDHLWSLSIEEQFYLFWPLVVSLCAPATLLGVAAATVVGGLFFRLWIALATSLWMAAPYFLLPGRLDALMAGAVLAIGRGRLARLRPLIAPTVAIALAALAGILVWRRTLFYNDVIVEIVAYPLVAALFGALLLAVLISSGGSRLTRLLSRPALQSLGKYSYGFYIVHYPLLFFIERWWPFPLQREWAIAGGSRFPNILLLAVVALPLSYAVAWLSYHLYESHFLKLKRFFSVGPPREGVTVSG
jgi:peptidoglycan/LPS O-acetylase OafA/YrhL